MRLAHRVLWVELLRLDVETRFANTQRRLMDVTAKNLPYQHEGCRETLLYRKFLMEFSNIP